MATNRAIRMHQLTCEVENRADHTIVHCSGSIVSDTVETLKDTVKPLIHEGTKPVVLDFTNVTYLDSSGLGTIVSLYVSARSKNSRLTLINLSPRIKELFSLTRLGEVITSERDPDSKGVFYSGM